MGRDRQIKIITIIALVVAITGMSLGFAAFSSTLSISKQQGTTYLIYQHIQVKHNHMVLMIIQVKF